MLKTHQPDYVKFHTQLTKTFAPSFVDLFVFECDLFFDEEDLTLHILNPSGSFAVSCCVGKRIKGLLKIARNSLGAKTLAIHDRNFGDYSYGD